MDAFHADGHLTEEALNALVRCGSMDGLTRLEAAEHLSFCDACLRRYTNALTGPALLAPARSCRGTLRRRLCLRTYRLAASRYATAAAAVALALTMLWNSGEIEFARSVRTERRPVIAERFSSWPRRWNDTFSQAVSDLSDFFDGLGGSGGIS